MTFVFPQTHIDRQLSGHLRRLLLVLHTQISLLLLTLFFINHRRRSSCCIFLLYCHISFQFALSYWLIERERDKWLLISQDSWAESRNDSKINFKFWHLFYAIDRLVTRLVKQLCSGWFTNLQWSWNFGLVPLQ